ncbi:NAD(P)H-hydrate dehydratase [Bacteroides sp. 214]|uniref:NAD(P)H-hydrate dehydratase n=1 Tax=Bacteroides sp. 214 TaxID=2302935 RepID=UPI0013D5B636|nr:NAD(P)H-hydrate dehydratase [Bacteroides sp. 214]NDW13360.1 NAD(P)H-hydrate dehydratase [Bacteroides sp. 214]
MKIFQAETIKELDAYTIEHEPISSIDLMERAAHELTNAIVCKWPAKTPVVIFAGPGNNGGDALAIARLLSEKGYQIEVFLFNPKGKLSPDCQFNKELVETLPEITFSEVSSQFVPPKLTLEHLVVDGLFGTGIKEPLSGGFAAVVKYINASEATVVAIDMPSGLMGEDNSENNHSAIIHADYTFSLQLPKLSFLFAENFEFVGKWLLLDIGISRQAIEEMETPFSMVEEQDIRPLIKSRKKFAHKGNFGHGYLVAGAEGMAGASILAAKACLRSGIGLLTIHTPACNNTILQTSVPEAMTELDIHKTCFAYPAEADNFDAIGIGPGLGQSPETEVAVLDFIKSTQTPMVIDADALNILANNKQLLGNIPVNSILTPHPKELERLVGKCQNSYERLYKACQLAHLCNVHIILKGAYSVTITPDGDCYFNPTGNAGMATGGSGDVLTGIVLALLAQGYETESAAKIATFVHGMAGDLAKQKYGMIAMTASDIIEFLPTAWGHISSM